MIASEQQKKAFHGAVENVEEQTETALAHKDPGMIGNVRATITAIRDELRRFNSWESKWGWLGWAYHSQADLLRQLGEAQNRLLLARGMVSHQAVRPDGTVNTRSPLAAGYQAGRQQLDLTLRDRAAQVARLFESPERTVKTLAVAAAAVGGGYLLWTMWGKTKWRNWTR